MPITLFPDLHGNIAVVVGASARAAVMSLARAGIKAWAVDLFCDRDLKGIAPCVRCPFGEFPQAIPQLTRQFPDAPVLYTGGLENHPAVIAQLAELRPVWGCDAPLLRRLRNPFQLQQLIHMPPMLPAGTATPEGRWLVKSLTSSGGLGIRLSTPGKLCPLGSYLQRFVEGPPMSAVFAGGKLLGITEQLIGIEWLHSRQFHYAGTIGPIELPSEMHRQIEQAGISLARGFHVPGIFGIDFILCDGQPWIVEVNPRYPASVEVLELSERRAKCPLFGKAIYFAPRSLAFPHSGPWDTDLQIPFDAWRVPAFADIPEPGESIAVGSPVITLFAQGASAEECRARLQSRAAELDSLFMADSQ